MRHSHARFRALDTSGRMPWSAGYITNMLESEFSAHTILFRTPCTRALGEWRYQVLSELIDEKLQKVRFNGSAGSSFAGSTTPTISSALSNLPASSSSSNDFEIGSSQNLRGIGYHHFQETGPAERCGACVSCERAGCQLQ